MVKFFEGASAFPSPSVASPARSALSYCARAHELGDGVCLPVESGQQWCAYPDSDCESGRRFSDFDVEPMYSGDCVPVEAEPPLEPPARRCNPQAPFEPPTLVPNVNSSTSDYGIKLSSDELTAFIDRVTSTPNEIMVSTRAATTDTFSAPVSGGIVAPIVNTPGNEYSASLAPDGVTLYFHRQQPAGELEIFASTRSSITGSFSSGSLVSVDSSALRGVLFPEISRSGDTLYWTDFNVGLHSAERASASDMFTRPRLVGELGFLIGYSLSPDELTLYYTKGSQIDVFVSTRSSKNMPFESGGPVSGLNSQNDDIVTFVTSDQCFLYFSSNRPGGFGEHDLWFARRGF